MLIRSKRHSPSDLVAWSHHEIMDARRAAATDWNAKAGAAAAEMRRFVSGGSCYLGVSWGKDSVVVAHIAIESGLDIPLIWVRVRDRENPECVLVRDAFLAVHPDARYEEITVSAAASGLTSGVGFKEASRRFGDRHISGVRSVESRARKIRTMRWGLSTTRACAPIARWSTDDVFAFLHVEKLPVHPAYGYSLGGTLPRDRLRVASIGGSRGTEVGRREWERRYYPEVLARARGS